MLLVLFGLYPAYSFIYLNLFPITKGLYAKAVYLLLHWLFCLFYEWLSVQPLGFFTTTVGSSGIQPLFTRFCLSPFSATYSFLESFAPLASSHTSLLFCTQKSPKTSRLLFLLGNLRSPYRSSLFFSRKFVAK